MAYQTFIYDPYRVAGADAPATTEYLNTLYPETARLIQSEVSRQCDRLDHPGSILYDEYPDKEALLFLADQIYMRVKDRSHPMVSYGLFVPITDSRAPVADRPAVEKDGTCSHISTPLYDLIKTILLHEIQVRRGFYY